ncbi:histidinol-phosphate transaminase [Novosphingobium sp. fls2-241-R2A-195]|jgi:histidinol-phosphate aminotransferase|uniref:pyridoxal phosphate-dependent aminotransferase n=1 Tax=Novosphingobium sp. fls2-241-R2A-195 TaxID=3040296 RepID=UPI00254A0A8B|nr:histidinol-phosphate transaminase [Novosphingobium sp. fls2-241-R2A-195]
MDARWSLSRRAWLGAAAVAPLAGAALAKSHPDVATKIRLDLNENAFGPSPRVAEALAAHIRGVERYVDQGEVDALTRRIAALERVPPEQVVIGEVLEPLGLHLARTHGGGDVVYSAPGYTALVDAGAALGARAVAIPLDACLENDLPALERAITDRTIAVNLVAPHNPSGTLNDQASLDAFIRRAAARTLVVVDEAYLEYDDLAGRSAVRLLRDGANVLVFRTLAKIYGLAGLSIGYAVAPAPLVRTLRDSGIGSPHSLSRLSLVAAAAALADQDHVRSIRLRTVAERERVSAVLDRLGLQRTDSRASFVYFRSPQAAALRDRFGQAGIAVGRPFPPLDDWIRITIGLPTENTAVIRVLESAHPHIPERNQP